MKGLLIEKNLAIDLISLYIHFLKGILQGLHFGLGRGIGAVFGGFLISIFGKVNFCLR